MFALSVSKRLKKAKKNVESVKFPSEDFMWEAIEKGRSRK